MGNIHVRPGVPADDAARDRFVLEASHGTFFHLAGWRRVIERVMGHEGCDLVAERGGTGERELVGVLPLMRCPSLFGAGKLISMPYAVYGGPVGESPEVALALYESAERAAVAEGARRLELRCLHDPGLDSHDLARSELYATFIHDLPDDPADVLARMPKKARAEARKARERHGLELSEGIGHLDELLRLFHRNKRDLGSPALPPALFRALADEFGERVVVHLVRRGTEPLAAVMSFLFRDTVLAYYSGTAAGADRAYSASNFMYLALQEWSVERGFRVFDFGRSRRDAGAFQFKVHQGFEPRPLHYRYRLIRDDAPPSLHPSNPKTKVLQDTWRRLPLWLARRLSTPVSRYLP